MSGKTKWTRDEEHELAVFMEESIKNYKAKKGYIWNDKKLRTIFENMIRKHKHLFPELSNLV